MIAFDRSTNVLRDVFGVPQPQPYSSLALHSSASTLP